MNCFGASLKLIILSMDRAMRRKLETVKFHCNLNLINPIVRSFTHLILYKPEAKDGESFYLQNRFVLPHTVFLFA